MTMTLSPKRQKMHDMLTQLPEGWQDRFRLMYGRKDGARTVVAAKRLSLQQVLHEIPRGRLSTAYQQIQASIEKLESSGGLNTVNENSTAPKLAPVSFGLPQ